MVSFIQKCWIPNILLNHLGINTFGWGCPGLEPQWDLVWKTTRHKKCSEFNFREVCFKPETLSNNKTMLIPWLEANASNDLAWRSVFLLKDCLHWRSFFWQNCQQFCATVLLPWRDLGFVTEVGSPPKVAKVST